VLKVGQLRCARHFASGTFLAGLTVIGHEVKLPAIID
jgi:hypothetical protein